MHRAWRDGHSELHSGFVGALLESPMDFAVRFAALNAYYHLMEHKRCEEEVDVLDRLAKQREAFRKKLRENMMVELRNREDHAKMGPRTDADADKMLDASSETLSLIYQDMRQLPGGVPPA